MQENQLLRAPTRRDVLRGLAGCALTLEGGAHAAGAAAPLGGVVFHDRAGSGQRRVGDRGVAGVLVSNGRDVVKTDADGRWQLHVQDGDTLFIVKPPNWSTPTRSGGRPRFSYSCASMNDREAGLVNVRAAPSSLDFPLVPSPEASQFEALLLADTQPANELELGYLRDDILVPAVAQGAAFGINHGDVVFDDLSLYTRYLQVMSATGLTWHHCPGNHDMDAPAEGSAGAWRTWERVFGPRNYAFQYAGAIFVILNNVCALGRNRPGVGGNLYCGRLGADQLRFVRNLLAQVASETLVVLSMHIPLVTYQDNGANPADNTADRRQLLRLLCGHPNCVSFSGHMHSTEHHYLDVDGRRPHHHHVLTAASGSWWGGPKDARGIPSAESPDGNPNGLHVLSVEGHSYRTRFVPAKAAGPMRLIIEGPAGPCTGHSVARNELAHCTLVVNMFDGGPLTRVSYEIAGTATGRCDMQRSVMTDPFVARKPWARAVPSSHIWKAPLPHDLAPGTYHVSVRATNEYGNAAKAHMLLDVRDAHLPD